MAFQQHRKSSLMSWPRSPPSCIASAIGSYATWTTGSSSDPLFRRSLGRETSLVALSGIGGSSESFQELPHSFPVSGPSGDDSADASFEGFPDSSSDPESALSRRRVCLLSSATSVNLEVSPGGNVINVVSGPRSSALDALLTASPQCGGRCGVGGRLSLLG